jgi:hypothetical protein
VNNNNLCLNLNLNYDETSDRDERPDAATIEVVVGREQN